MTRRPGTRTAGVSGGSGGSDVSSVAGRTGDVVLTKADVGLSSVDDTADTAKPVSSAQATAIALKVAKSGDTMTGLLDLAAGAANAGGLRIGTDVNLYRGSADTLRTDDALDVNGSLLLTSATPNIVVTAINAANRSDVFLQCRVAGESNHQFYMRSNGSLNWGAGGATAADVILYRDAADVLATDDNVKIKRASTSNLALTSYVGAEANARLAVQANGVMTWGPGSGAGDVNLYRGASDVLKTDDALEVVQSLYADSDVFARSNGTYEVKIGDIGSKAGLTFGSAADTNLYRSAADTLKTDDSFHVGATLRHLGSSLGFFNAAAVTKPTVTGSRGDGSALADLLTELATLGLITDSSSA